MIEVRGFPPFERKNRRMGHLACQTSASCHRLLQGPNAEI